MDDKIVNFFKFLEEKRGITTPCKVKLLNPNKFKLTKEDLNIKGNLDLQKSDVAFLPNNLNIIGNLNLSGSKIVKLPNNLKVTGALYIARTKINKLPDDLIVLEGLSVRNTNVMLLPNGVLNCEEIWVDSDKLEYFRNKYPTANILAIT